MLINSYIYYELDDNIISDYDFDRFATQLRDLQDTYPELHFIGVYDKDFIGWTGESGAFLPLKDPYVIRRATNVYNQYLKYKK